LPFRKEVGYFTRHYRKGARWYESLFETAPPGAVCGEISPDYFLCPEAADRIARHDSTIQVILCVREPASWAVSYYRYLPTQERRIPAFDDFLECHAVPDPRIFRRRSTPATFSIRNSIVERRVEQYRSLFGSRLLIYDFALFQRNPLLIMRSIEQFLGLVPWLTDDKLPGRPINSSHQRRFRLMSHLLGRDEFVSIAGFLFPRRFLQKIRLRLDLLSSPTVPHSQSRDDSALLEIARKKLSSDRNYFESLFAEGQVINGDGRRYPA
jgi:hypothetical protein